MTKLFGINDSSIKHLAIGTTIVGVIFVLGPWIYSKGKDLFKKDPVRTWAEDASDILYYGDDKLTNSFLAIQAEAKDWNFSYQEPGAFIETSNDDIPYITTNRVCFTNPQNDELHRCLTKTWIFDADCQDWVPLSQDVFEYDSKSKKLGEKIKLLSAAKLWQGDYNPPPCST